MTKRGVAFVLLCCLALCATVAGCGSSQRSSRQAFLESHRLDLLMPDCSASFRQASERLVPEMVAVAQNSASQKRILWAGCFAGAPLRTLIWNPKVDFGELPSAVSNSAQLAERLNEARALGLKRKLEAMVRHTPLRAPGSGQLEALEVASQTADVGRVIMYTDAEINEPQGVSLSKATPAEIRQAIQLWAPRMKGLRGVQLMLVGVGYGAHNSTSVRNAEMLFRGLAKRVGMSSFSWSQSLPVTFSSSS
jgi:hypothetical protein